MLSVLVVIRIGMLYLVMLKMTLREVQLAKKKKSYCDYT